MRNYSNKSNVITFNLCTFLGVLGAHRFYAGKPWTALLQLFTLGGLLIWATIDWFYIVNGNFTDGEQKIIRWHLAQPGSAVGFWHRFCAHVIDCIILILLYQIYSFILLIVPFGYIALLMIALTIDFIYYTMFHCSAMQATIGKKCVGICVVDNENKRISIIRSLARTIGYFLSYTSLYIGFIMIGLRKDNRGLHDIVAQTKVIYANKTK
jgi:uncharacterized RDD family membrane protein YckC/TM2 domain-containing membrane protein YozV